MKLLWGVAITVADNGSGMSKETESKLFKAFYTTKGDLGTGLGQWVSQILLNVITARSE